MSLIKSIKASYSHIPYTWNHKIAMLKLEKKFTGHNSLRVILHDADKLITYTLLPFLTLHQHKQFHRLISAHHHYNHIDKLPKAVLREIVLDWESCHYTKADKPECAVEFCLRNKPWCYAYLKPIFEEFHLI